MKPRSFLPAVALGLFALSTAPASAETWNMATGFSEGNFQTKNVHFFAEEVKRLSGGKLNITVHSGMSLYRQPEIKRAVSSGQIQAGEILLSAYGNENPLFEADSIPFLATGYEQSRALWLKQKPLLDKVFEKEGMLLLYSVAWPGTAIYSKAPVKSLADLKGVKMRAYNAATSRLAERFGAVPTTVEQVEVPQAFATGVIQAMITSPITGVDTQSWDYIKYYTDTRAWHNKNFVIVNRRAFSRLDEATQKAVMEAAKNAEERGWKLSEEVGAEAVKTLTSKGVTIIEPSAELQAELQQVGQDMIAEWVKRAGADGEGLVKQVKQ